MQLSVPPLPEVARNSSQHQQQQQQQYLNSLLMMSTAASAQQQQRELSSGSPLSAVSGADSSRSMSPDGQSSPVRPADVSSDSPLKMAAAAMATGYGMPMKGYYPALSQFGFPYGLPLPYGPGAAQHYELFANGLLGAAAASVNQSANSIATQNVSPSAKKSTNFSVASLLGDRKAVQPEEDLEDDVVDDDDENIDVDEDDVEDDEEDELMRRIRENAAALDMSPKSKLTHLNSPTGSPSHGQTLSPPNSRSTSPLSPKGKPLPVPTMPQLPAGTHPGLDPAMSAALQLQLAAAAAARHRFTVDSLMLDAHQQQQQMAAMGSPFGLPPGAHPALLAAAAASAGGQNPTAPWQLSHGLGMPVPGSNPTGAAQGHPQLNPFHWLSHTSGPLSPSQSKFF